MKFITKFCKLHDNAEQLLSEMEEYQEELEERINELEERPYSKSVDKKIEKLNEELEELEECICCISVAIDYLDTSMFD